MDLKLVCHFILLVILISAQASSAVETYDELYVGCFKDARLDRVLPDDELISDVMTIKLCIDYCKELTDVDSVYAGVENLNECYCGVASRNYARLGVAEDGQCEFGCAGDSTTICGGSGSISIYNLLLIRTPTTTETVSSSVISTSHDASTASDKPTEESNDSTIPISTHSTTSDPSTIASVQSTLMTSSLQPVTGDKSSIDPSTIASVQSTLMTSSLQPVTGDKSGIGLYAGAGGGGALILILIIIIVCVTCRRSRNKEKRSRATDQPLTTMITSKDGNQECRKPTDEEEDPCYENKSAEKERDYQNMTVDTNELTYKNLEKRSTMKEATHDPAALYAMPDMAAKNSSRPKTYTSPPNDTDDPSLMYAMPDRRAKTVYSSKSKAALGEDNLHALYATSTKSRLEPIGMEATANGEGLYALPDENPRDHVTQNGAGKRGDVEAMYAMPDKSRRGNDIDNTVMIENDIYSST